VKDQEGTDLERRGLLVWLSRGFLALWAPAAAGVVTSFLQAPSAEHRPGERTLHAGSFSSLPVGDARFVHHGNEPVIVIRASETQVVALSAICTHMRCVLRWERETGTIRCPCHDGLFDRKGNPISGPPKRALPQYGVEVRADDIVVHT